MKKWMFATLLASTLTLPGCFFSGGCEDTPDENEYLIETTLTQEALKAEDVPNVSPEDQKKWANQVNHLGHRFMTENYKRDENIVFSPAALHGTIAMAGYGANGSTYDEIVQVLTLEDERDKATRLSANMMLNLRYDGQKEDSRFIMASNLWVDEKVSVSQSFKDDMLSMFKAPVQIVNFLDYTFFVLETIKDWMMDITHEYLSQWIGSDNPEFMLVNATSFEGKWELPFDSSKTLESLFFGSTKDTLVDFMHLIYDFEYYENDEKGYQAVIIPYMEGTFDMVIILPNNKETAQDVLQNVSPEDFGTIMMEAADTKLIELSLPKFDVSFDLPPEELISRLQNIGIKEAFTEGLANFDIFSPSYNVFIDSFIHQAVISISEGGTNVDNTTTGTPDKVDDTKEVLQFNVDHAFAFALVHRSSGAIVYLGLMNEIE